MEGDFSDKNSLLASPPPKRARACYKEIIPSTNESFPLPDDHPLKDLITQNEKLTVREVLIHQLNKDKPKLSNQKCKKKIDIKDVDVPGPSNRYYYTLSPFWVIPSSQHDTTKKAYLPLKDLIETEKLKGILGVNLPFKIKGKEVKMTFQELLDYNGIEINDLEDVSDLYEFFSMAQTVIHPKIYYHLLYGSGEIHDTICELSATEPPFINLDIQSAFDQMEKLSGNNLIRGERILPGSIPIVVSPLKQLLIAIASETSFDIYPVAKSFGVSERTVERIEKIKEILYSNSAKILINLTPTEPIEISEEMRTSTRIRRNSYVAINSLIWRLFTACSTHGINLNGKILREQAIYLSAQLGLRKSFKGSDGWLNSFKKRHNIDMRRRTGSPCEDEFDFELDLEELKKLIDFKCQNIEDLIFYRKVEDVTPRTTISIELEETRPLDLKDLIGDVQEEENILENFPNLEEICKSTSITIPNPQISQAIETIRNFIIKYDPSVLSHLVNLQVKLTEIAEANPETCSI